MRIIINGVGIAGPTLAYWLRRAGHEVLLVESAPGLRGGGYVIDFWGVGYTIAEKMGLIPRIMEQGYNVREVRFVDRRGRTRGGFSTAMFHRILDGRFTSLRRSDLAAAIHGVLGAEVETRFGDSVARIEEVPGAVRVGFDRGDSLLADLVIGADGLHSRVRRLVFGPEESVEVPLGYHVAAFELEGYRPRDDLVYISHGAPGRQISRFSMRDDKTLILLIFRDEYLTDPGPLTTDTERKAALTRAFAGIGWEWPAIESALADVEGLYFDRVSQIRMDRWTKGRVALIGDAAACVSLLAGEGTGLAMAEAYVLAGELGLCVGDPAAALVRYEERMRPFLREKQVAAAGFASSFAPRTALGITFRNLVTRLFRLPLLGSFVLGRSLRDDFALPDYEF